MAKRLLSPERQAALLARYPHEGNQALAADFGLTAAQVASIAFENKVHKTKATRSALSAHRAPGEAPSAMQQALAAVGDAGAAGMSRAEVVARLPGLRVDKTLDSLATRGYLHAAGPHGKTRWFANPADAHAHAAATGATQRVSQGRRAARLRAHSTPAVQPSAQPTICAPVLGRAPATRAAPGGLFSDLGAGQYIDERPRAWVAAATRRA